MKNFLGKFFQKKKIGIWHNIKLNKLKFYRKKKFKLNPNLFIKYLKKFGYNPRYSNSRELIKIIKSFQSRFRPELVDGKIDLECFEIIKSLNNVE